MTDPDDEIDETPEDEWRSKAPPEVADRIEELCGLVTGADPEDVLDALGPSYEPDPDETETGSADGPTDDELRARIEALEESIKEGAADPETAATATTEPDLTDDATTDAEADGGPEETDETDDTETDQNDDGSTYITNPT